MVVQSVCPAASKSAVKASARPDPYALVICTNPTVPSAGESA